MEVELLDRVSAVARGDALVAPTHAGVLPSHVRLPIVRRQPDLLTTRLGILLASAVVVVEIGKPFAVERIGVAVFDEQHRIEMRSGHEKDPREMALKYA